MTPTRADAPPVPARPLAPEAAPTRPTNSRPGDSPKTTAKGGPVANAREASARPAAEGRAEPQRSATGDRLGVDGAAARAFRSLLGARGGAEEAADPFEEAVAEAATEVVPAWAGGPPPADVSAAAPVAPAIALALDPAAVARADRMAAAVAEAIAQGRDPVYSIRFNDPDGLAEGALLIRDAGGALIVRLEGVTPAALAVAPAALESQLRLALGRRRVRLSRVEYGAPMTQSLTKSKRFAEAI